MNGADVESGGEPQQGPAGGGGDMGWRGGPGRGSLPERWKRAPGPARKIVAGVVGVSLIAGGTLLIVLPGPFTMPLLLAGLAVLGTEYQWARRTLEAAHKRAGRTKQAMARKLRR